MRVLDLFCGGGGASLGLKMAGHQVVGIDSDEEVLELYHRNVGKGICENVSKLEPKDFQGFDCLFASPPWSLARSRNLPRREDADVGTVVVRWVEAIQPQIFLMENVPRYRDSESYREITSCLSRLGYLFDANLVNMAEWGIPQTRTRLILRAYRHSLLPPFPPQKMRRGWDEVLNFEELAVDDRKVTLGDRQMLAIKEFGFPNTALVEHTGARSDCLPQIKLPGEPCWTIRASLTRSGDKYPIRAVIQGIPVKLGLRDVARLCTFPDDYDLGQKTSVAGRLLGNAVPPEFARILLP